MAILVLKPSGKTRYRRGRRADDQTIARRLPRGIQIFLAAIGGSRWDPWCCTSLAGVLQATVGEPGRARPGSYLAQQQETTHADLSRLRYDSEAKDDPLPRLRREGVPCCGSHGSHLLRSAT